jgi:hypothetical protein
MVLMSRLLGRGRCASPGRLPAGDALRLIVARILEPQGKRLACRAGARRRRLATLERGMLHEGNDPGGHEAGRAHRLARAGDFGDLHCRPRHGDLHPPPSLGGGNLELLYTTPADVDDDEHSITLHRHSFALRRLDPQSKESALPDGV